MALRAPFSSTPSSASSPSATASQSRSICSTSAATSAAGRASGPAQRRAHAMDAGLRPEHAAGGAAADRADGAVAADRHLAITDDGAALDLVRLLHRVAGIDVGRIVGRAAHQGEERQRRKRDREA